MKNELISIC